jgi:hypothetical protein
MEKKRARSAEPEGSALKALFLQPFLGPVFAKHGSRLLDASDLMALEQSGRCTRLWVARTALWKIIFERDFSHVRRLEPQSYKRLYKAQAFADWCNTASSMHLGKTTKTFIVQPDEILPSHDKWRLRLPAREPGVLIYYWTPSDRFMIRVSAELEMDTVPVNRDLLGARPSTFHVMTHVSRGGDVSLLVLDRGSYRECAVLHFFTPQ